VAQLDADVVGVSLDPPEKHAQFAAANELPYPLISDGNAEIAKAYGVSRVGGWLPTKRVTFVIGKDGIVKRVIRGELNVDRHIAEAVEALRQLEGKS
jgi:peroxiredoxin Q/BCP